MQGLCRLLSGRVAGDPRPAGPSVTKVDAC